MPVNLKQLNKHLRNRNTWVLVTETLEGSRWLPFPQTRRNEPTKLRYSPGISDAVNCGTQDKKCYDMQNMNASVTPEITTGKV